MEVYTEIYVSADLKKETPKEVIDVLSAMCEKSRGSECLRGKPVRWGYLFNNGSHYLPLTECGKPTKTECGKLRNDSNAGQYSLLAKGDIKNYGGEIEKFFDFIKPWCEGEFIGYYRHEESREPTLVYADV